MGSRADSWEAEGIRNKKILREEAARPFVNTPKRYPVRTGARRLGCGANGDE